MAKLEIKLVKSTIGRLEKHQRTVQALGLKKIGQTIVKEATPSIIGMVKAIDFMLEVKEVE
jgi:large subunit ribosomal protein L30